jgi:hypothetical protein
VTADRGQIPCHACAATPTHRLALRSIVITAENCEAWHPARTNPPSTIRLALMTLRKNVHRCIFYVSWNFPIHIVPSEFGPNYRQVCVPAMTLWMLRSSISAEIPFRTIARIISGQYRILSRDQAFFIVFACVCGSQTAATVVQLNICADPIPWSWNSWPAFLYYTRNMQGSNF